MQIMSDGAIAVAELEELQKESWPIDVRVMWSVPSRSAPARSGPGSVNR